MTVFWIAATIMVLGFLAAIAWPLFNGTTRTEEEAFAPDILVYRDQIKEIDRDLERGTISQGEASAIRLEIQRRLLSADSKRQLRKRLFRATSPRNVLMVAIIGIFVATGSTALYFEVGAPGAPDQPFASRTADRAMAQQNQQMLQMATQLKERLDQNPNQPEGWLLLGRTYRTLDRFQDSAVAFKRAVETSNRAAEALSAYGGALVLLNQGAVTSEARDVFAETIVKNPRDGRARFYVGLAKEQAGDLRGALQEWIDLAAMAPPGAAWLPQVQERIAQVASQAGIDPATIKPSGTVPDPGS